MISTKELKAFVDGLPKNVVQALGIEVEVRPNPERPDHILITKPVFINIPIYAKLSSEESDITIRVQTESVMLTVWKSFPEKFTFTIYEKR